MENPEERIGHSLTHGGKTAYTEEQVLEAVPGSLGVVTYLARKLKIDSRTVREYLERWPAVKTAFEEEAIRIVDLSEVVVKRNVELSERTQMMNGVVVDSTDARWFLSRKGKDRGYSERTELSGPEGSEVTVRLVGNVSADDV